LLQPHISFLLPSSDDHCTCFLASRNDAGFEWINFAKPPVDWAFSGSLHQKRRVREEKNWSQFAVEIGFEKKKCKKNSNDMFF
jgi:hypothetical protein